MIAFFLIAILCHRNVLSYNATHQNLYELQFMPDNDFGNLQYTRQYTVDLNVQLQCGWNSSLVNQWPPLLAQDSLLFDQDVNTLSCQPFESIAGVNTALSPNAVTQLGTNLALQAYIQNGSTFYQFPLQFVANSTFSLPLNRTALSTSKGIAALPWEVQIFATVLPPTDDFNSYYKNSFTILDPYSDPYYSWHYGQAVAWSTIYSANQKILYVKNPCAPQVVLFIIPGSNGTVYIGKSWTKAVDPPPIKWYVSSLQVATGQICTVTGAAGLVRYLQLQTDNCGYFLSNPLAVELYTIAPSNQTNVGTLTGAQRVVNFTQVTSFGTPPTGLGDLSTGGSGSWCYLRRNIQPSASLAAVDTVTPSDWLSVKNSTTSQWSLIREPLNSGQLISAITSFQLNLTANLRMNAAYTKELITDLQATPGNIISSYINTPTSTYYFLYKKTTSTGATYYSLYSQALSDTLVSLTTARLIYNFKATDDPPLRILSHPSSTDLFVLGDQVAWLLSSNGQSLKKLFDLRKFESASAPGSLSLGNMLFSQNGTLSYFITKNQQIYRGNSYYGGYLPVTLKPPSVTELLVDTVGVLHRVLPGSVSLFVTPTETDHLNLTTQPQLVPLETLTGYFSVVPFTRKTFMVVQWAPQGTTYGLEFSPGDIGRMLVQTVPSGSTIVPGTAHIIGYGDLTETYLASWSSAAVQPVSYIVMEAVSPFFMDTSNPATVTTAPITITLNADKSVSLTTTASLQPFATVLIERFNPDGSLQFRGSFLVSGACTATCPATALLLTGAVTTGVTYQASEWKTFQLSTDAGLISWRMQDHWYCPFEFLANQSNIGPWDHHMDRGDEWNLTIQMRQTRSIPPGEVPRKSKGSFMPNYLLHKAGNPWRLHVRSEMLGDGMTGWNLTYQVEEVGSDYNQDNMVTSLSFRMGNPTLGCGIGAAVPVTVVSGCIRGVALTYAFPDGFISEQEWNHPTMLNKIGDFVVGPVPVNYRPPSANGTAFPTSKILYNADPSQPYKQHFSNPQNYTPTFGCTVATPDFCTPVGTCTDAQRADPYYINCLNRTVYLPFSGDHYFKFHLLSHFQDAGPLDTSVPLQVTELNGRSDFIISTPPEAENFVLQLLSSSPNYAGVSLYVSNSTIRFTGTGLYHFQVGPAFDYSYCSNSLYFTVWLYSATLPFPMEQVCLCGMALLVALWLCRALTLRGENTLLDCRRHSALRPPDRVPLRDEYVDAEAWDELDLEAEVEAMNPKKVIPVEAADDDSSRSNVLTD